MTVDRRRFGPARLSRPRRIGKGAWRPEKKAGSGRCTYCGDWFGNRDWDHCLPRGLFPNDIGDNRVNLVPVCRPCHTKRTDGKLKPSWYRLPKHTRDFMLSWWTPARIARHFSSVPAAELEGRGAGEAMP
jgi:5-methylcytosine-specific restriction endonuclease McrA